MLRFYGFMCVDTTFVFLKAFFEWKSFCAENKIEIYKKLDDLNH